MPTARKDLPVYELLITEVLQRVSNAKTKTEKIELLRNLNSDALRAILIWNFDESIKSAVPDGDVPYTPNDAPVGTDHTRLFKEHRNLYRFIVGGDNGLNRIRREQLFIQLLENLHKDEAELICLVKDKKMQDKYRITKAVVEEAFPKIKWGNRG